MRPDDGGIDDQILEVRIIGHRLEDPPPHTLDAPSTEAPEHAVPIPERFRKITPGRARTHDPKHTFHEHPVVAPGGAFLVRTTYNQGRHPLPNCVAQNKRSITPKAASPKEALNLICLLRHRPHSLSLWRQRNGRLGLRYRLDNRTWRISLSRSLKAAIQPLIDMSSRINLSDFLQKFIPRRSRF